MNKFLDISERILHIIDNEYNGNKKKFAESIDFAPQVISNIVGGRKSKPSYNLLCSICESIDGLNGTWLLTGKGEMLNKNENVLQKVEDPGTNYEKKSSELKMCQDYVEMQKKYIANLESQLAKCRDDVNAQKNAG